MNVAPRQLRVFLVLAGNLSFRETAEQFFVTQPALTKIVQDLEAQLGVVLFERTTRKVRLTAAGERLLPLARRTAGEFDDGLRQMKDLSERETQRLAIAALPSLASTLLPDVCADVEQTYPDARIAVHDVSTESAIVRVQDYEVDFALAYASPVHVSLHFEEVARDRFVLLAAGALGKRIAGRPMRLADLVDLPVISMTHASTAMRVVSAALLRQGIEFAPKYQLDQLGTIASFVQRGLGIALLPYLGAVPLPRVNGMRLAPLEDAPVRSIGIVSRRSTTHNAIALRALDSVRRHATRLVERYPEWVLPRSGKRSRHG